MPLVLVTTRSAHAINHQGSRKRHAVTIILKTAAPSGWKPANGLLERGQTMTCGICGAICDESATGDHEAWHAAIEDKTLPLLADYVTELAENHDDQPDEHIGSVKMHVQLPKFTAADSEG
jgi:hypothetical protein